MAPPDRRAPPPPGPGRRARARKPGTRPPLRTPLEERCPDLGAQARTEVPCGPRSVAWGALGCPPPRALGLAGAAAGPEGASAGASRGGRTGLRAWAAAPVLSAIRPVQGNKERSAGFQRPRGTEVLFTCPGPPTPPDVPVPLPPPHPPSAPQPVGPSACRRLPLSTPVGARRRGCQGYEADLRRAAAD